MLARRRLLVSGLVQGVGFRPYIYNLAQTFRLTGRVGNDTSGVFVEVQGCSEAVVAFTCELMERAPPAAAVEAVRVEELTPREETGFVIVESEDCPGGGVVVPPDVAICDDCLLDLYASHDRRFRYPFVTCCRCGPRFTVLRDTPFDRVGTTMATFRMCAACEAEYRDPADRRFHAQTSACPACGPRVWFTAPAAGLPVFGDAAVERVREALAAGSVVAVKGVGGFHLACDATNDQAVRRLRERKGRGDKPFALMAASPATVRQYADFGPVEEQLLTGRERPIVLLRRRHNADAPSLSPAVAPANGYLGFMLPYTPLHHLLLGDCPLVMTSGNVSDEPIVTTNEAAVTKLAPMADAFLFHDREIHSPCDDSVVRAFGGAIYPMRRARGYAPIPIRVGGGPAVLAVGGELKAAFCLTSGEWAHLSPHIGDTGKLETLTAFERAVDLFRRMLRVEPQVVACDAHPGYLSARWAAAYAERHQLPLIRVRHHHAHVASLLAEHGRVGPIIGMCFDGTGYGNDGAVWGGEILVGGCRTCRRVAHLDYVSMPGGDAVIERPYRMALAHLWAAGVEWDDSLPCFRACSLTERSILLAQLQKNINAPPTSSVGRLFDAVAALIGVRQTITYEAQAAIELESLADGEHSEGYEFALFHGVPLRLDPRPVVRQIVRDLIGGIPQAGIAAKFHRGLAEAVARVCRLIRDQTGLTAVGLTGGVFQNVLLLRLTSQFLGRDGFEVLVHRQVPPNDGGLSLGQAVIVQASLSAVAT